MASDYAAEVDLFFTDRTTARGHWRQDAEQVIDNLGEPDGWMAHWGDAAGTDEARSWDLASHLAAGIKESLSDGDDGWWDDWYALLTPWGCDLTMTRVPVHLWHGTQDQAVPIGHGRWLATHIPGIEVDFSDAQDHSNVESENRESAYAWLRAQTR